MGYPRVNFIHNKSDFFKAVSLGETTENLTLDFKRELNLDCDKNKKKEELALDICQFCNTWGGVVLIGIEEHLNQEGFKVATCIKNTSNYEDISRFVHDSVLTQIYPTSIRVDIEKIIIDNFTIVAINIYPLKSGLSCFYNLNPPFTAKYPYRTHYGKKYFKPHEIEKRLSVKSRYVFLKLNELMTKTIEVSLYPPVKTDNPDKKISWDVKNGNIIVSKTMDDEFTLNLHGMNINIPYSFVKEVWMVEDKKIGILLKVGLRLSSDRRSIILEF